jgi:hypothetical protein
LQRRALSRIERPHIVFGALSTELFPSRQVAGFMAGFTYVATAFGITYLFEFRSLKLWAINAGYQLVVLSVMGAILGGWH